MSFQAYLDNVKAKTGKTTEDFARLAAQKSLAKHGDIVKWLKSDFSLGHGHATAIAGVLTRQGTPTSSAEEKIQRLFDGKKKHWQEPSEKLIARMTEFGADFSASAGGTYVSLLRAGKKFAILQPSSTKRLDIGIKLKGVAADEQFESARNWNAMVTHRVRVSAPNQIDRKVVFWLKRAYDAAA
jgi:Domain of unknown function (DUF4287)/Domain of unknown function (DUF5655)